MPRLFGLIALAVMVASSGWAQTPPRGARAFGPPAPPADRPIPPDDGAMGVSAWRFDGGAGHCDLGLAVQNDTGESYDFVSGTLEITIANAPGLVEDVVFRLVDRGVMRTTRVWVAQGCGTDIRVVVRRLDACGGRPDRWCQFPVTMFRPRMSGGPVPWARVRIEGPQTPAHLNGGPLPLTPEQRAALPPLAPVPQAEQRRAD